MAAGNRSWTRLAVRTPRTQRDQRRRAPGRAERNELSAELLADVLTGDALFLLPRLDRYKNQAYEGLRSGPSCGAHPRGGP